MRNSILVSRQESISTLDLSHIPLLNERTLFFYTKHIQDGRKMPLPTFRFILLDVNLFFFVKRLLHKRAIDRASKQASLSTYAGISFFCVCFPLVSLNSLVDFICFIFLNLFLYTFIYNFDMLRRHLSI